MHRQLCVVITGMLLAFAPAARAQSAVVSPADEQQATVGEIAQVRHQAATQAGAQDQAGAISTSLSESALAQAPEGPARPVAIEYSEGYGKRAKIHKIASFATLPLLGTEAALGQSLYTSGGGGKKTAHIIVGTAITGLFAVNTVTGVWNLMESRKDPNHRALRLLHGILMLGADTGFAAAFGTAPNGEHFGNFNNSRSTHRAIALTSIGVGTGGYLLMLFGNH